MKKLILSVFCLTGLATCYAEDVAMDIHKMVVKPSEVYIEADRGIVIYTDGKTYIFKELRFEDGHFVVIW